MKASRGIKIWKNVSIAKRDYVATSYFFDRCEVRAKVLLKYSILWLDFLDERSNDDGNAKAPMLPWTLLMTYPRPSEIFSFCKWC